MTFREFLQREQHGIMGMNPKSIPLGTHFGQVRAFKKKPGTTIGRMFTANKPNLSTRPSGILNPSLKSKLR